jgi:hypothetical protein
MVEVPECDSTWGDIDGFLDIGFGGVRGDLRKERFWGEMRGYIGF